jgi:hypothetical protein
MFEKKLIGLWPVVLDAIVLGYALAYLNGSFAL